MQKAPPTPKGFSAKGKTAVFIDAANILYSQQTLGWEIDYKKLIEYFRQNTKLVVAFFYSGKISKNRKQEKFFRKMRSFGYNVKTKEVKWIKDRNNKVLKGKGNLDIELALDMSHLTHKYDTAVLLSGDSDFAPLLEFVKEHGKRTVVVSTKYHIAKELIAAADHYINLKNIRKFIERGKKS